MSLITDIFSQLSWPLKIFVLVSLLIVVARHGPGVIEHGSDYVVAAKCRTLLDKTNDTLRSLEAQVSGLNDLLISETAASQKATSDYNNFLTSSSDRANSFIYDPKYAYEALKREADNRENKADFTKKELIGALNKTINEVLSIREHCLSIAK